MVQLGTLARILKITEYAFGRQWGWTIGNAITDWEEPVLGKADNTMGIKKKDTYKKEIKKIVIIR